MPVLFEVTDPRGKKVICSEENWIDHVLYNHPNMEGSEADVAATIEAPSYSMIYQDKNYPERNLYYRKQPKEYYIKAIVEFTEKQSGKLITAFITDSPKPGEALIWTPQSRD